MIPTARTEDHAVPLQAIVVRLQHLILALQDLTQFILGSGDDYCGQGCQSEYGTCGSAGGSGSSTTSSPLSSTTASSGACSTVAGVGSFANHVTYDFSTLSSLPDGLTSVTETDPAGTAPFSRTYDPSLTTVTGGYAQLTVPGGQSSSPIRGASFQTTANDILYASVRTTAILTGTKGVCNGFFFYSPTGEEIDIEFLSDASSDSNPGDGSTPLHLTNHLNANSGERQALTASVPSDATTSEHEYRVDWVSGSTTFYIDGQQVAQATQDVPSEGGPWIWNNWSNGDKEWSVGPPATDAVLKISKVEMYYNTASDKC